jgi:hypothetical protein
MSDLITGILKSVGRQQYVVRAAAGMTQQEFHERWMKLG